MLGAVADRALDPEAVWSKFARDSPLEGDGFELPVPRTPAESPCKPDALDQVDFGLLLRWLERLLCALLRALLAASPPAQIA